ncbi:hypothetical protein BGZ58_006422 [Dissophora ornata]|nr:hypothetical protein BGZ58_006422 [Dissophora ornata]
MKTNVPLSLSVALAAAFVSADSLEAPCVAALQEALCLLEFPKCQGQTQNTLPVCWSVRDHVARTCYNSLKHTQAASSMLSQYATGDKPMTLAQLSGDLFTPLFDSRWASSASVQEPNCVSFRDHGLGTSPIDNIKVVNDLGDDSIDRAGDRAEEERWLKEQSATGLNADQGGLFVFPGDEESAKEESQPDIVKATLNARHLSRRDRVKHHHHHQKEKRSDEAVAAPQVEIRADQTQQSQSVYKLEQVDGVNSGTDKVLVHESLGHVQTSNENEFVGEGQQKILIQAGAGVADPASAASSFGKASAGHPSEQNAADAAATEREKEATSPHNGTVAMAAVPILLLMGAIAGFTVYRRYYENSFNQGGRNDTRDDYPDDGYLRRDLPIRKGSPIHFDRTFLNTIHSPPPTATYLHDPENSSRSQSPSSITSVSMKRPPPSAGSHGKTRFQELSRSYDFGAGFRSIKNALTRSNNNSRDGGLDHASGSSGSGSNSSLNGKKPDYAFGSGGHSIAKIGSHPGLNALERQQLQQQYGAAAGGSSSSRFPDVNTLTVPQEQSIIWGQYSANDDGIYQDAASAVASNLARKSVSSNSLNMLSGGKYSHHHQQSSGHQPGTPTDSIGDCLSPESPTMTREEMMRRRDLYAEGYAFGSEVDDTHSGTDLLFDARDHFFDLGAEKVHEAALRDEEMDMYLNMEKEESPYALDDYNSMNPNPYEPKVFKRHPIDTNSIQKTASLNEKELYPSQPSLDGHDEEIDEKKALEAQDQAEQVAIAVIEPEETHVLGCDSPEWNASSNSGQRQAVENASVTEAFDRVQVALGVVDSNSGLEAVVPVATETVDPSEWEEDSRAASSASLPQQGGAQQGQGQSKRKGNKSKSKKGRKN